MTADGRHHNGSGRAPGRYGGLRLVMAGDARHPSAAHGVGARPSPDDWELVDRFMASAEAIGMSVPPQHALDVVARFIRFAEREHRDIGSRVAYEPYAVARRRSLYEEIGGAAAAAALDDRPLPDEPFDWDGLDHADHDLVADILRRADEACAVFLDVEMRTLCRRGLAALVRHDRALFERSQRTDLIAAGLVWATLRVNEIREWRDPPFGRPQQLAVADFMGVSSGSMSGRANSIEVSWTRAGAMRGAPNCHSARRRAYLAELASLSAGDDDDELRR